MRFVGSLFAALIVIFQIPPYMDRWAHISGTSLQSFTYFIMTFRDDGVPWDLQRNMCCHVNAADGRSWRLTRSRSPRRRSSTSKTRPSLPTAPSAIRCAVPAIACCCLLLLHEAADHLISFSLPVFSLARACMQPLSTAAPPGCNSRDARSEGPQRHGSFRQLP